MPNSTITITFWGVRGGMPAPGAGTQSFGGNSPCVEMRCGDHVLIFDAGTGIRALGKALIAQSPVTADLFFSTTRFNYICGLPFFAAAFNPANTFRLWCGNAQQGNCIKDVLAGLMNDPIFPVPLDIFNAALTFWDFRDGEDLDIGDGITVATRQLTGKPPGTAYRISLGDKSVCYLAGSCIGSDQGMEAVIGFARDADLLIFGPPATGTGNTDKAWSRAAELAEAATVRRLVLSGHAPEDDDEILEVRQARLARDHPGILLAREGQEITV